MQSKLILYGIGAFYNTFDAGKKIYFKIKFIPIVTNQT